MQIGMNQSNRRSGMATAYGHGNMHAVHDPHQIAAASNGLINTMADTNLGNMLNQFNALTLSGDAMMGPGSSMPAHANYVNGANANFVFTPYAGPVHPVIHDPAFAAAYPMQYPVGAFGGPYTQGMMPYTPGRAVTYSTDRLSRDVPGLDNRRASYSTSGTESSPATPFGMNVSDRVTGTRIASAEHSHYTTPSPRQTISEYMSHGSKPLPDPEMERLLMQDPPIPKAVPAVWTEHIKTLDQCLENRITGNRNVYIRGLHPTTDDELLSKYAERFGEVEQSKAIIDTATGACKGFGFSKFKDVKDSEKCIRGFYRLGYEVGFARESFNARLKAEGDDASTNLYISNLPKNINENTLVAIFEPFRIVSSKILRDNMGNSRGVGFARFESREICEKVIEHYHGIQVGDEAFVMQVRYADTPAQKELKRITAERRQYRTNEYNIGAYGTHAVGINPTIYNSNVWSRRATPVPYNGTGLHPGNAVTSGNAVQGAVPAVEQTKTESATVSSDDGSADEGLTIVDSPTVKKRSSSSSPSVKKECA